jgi:hypothetical protein
MTTFKVNDQLSIECKCNNTRNGFCHRATLHGWKEDLSTYVSYLNRTWESYDYETVLRQLLTKMEKKKIVTHDQSLNLIVAWGKDPNLNGMGALKSLGMAMAMGEILAGDKKEDKIAWKKRMAKAGGLDVPEDFDDLPIEEKERRLNGVQDMLLEPKK